MATIDAPRTPQQYRRPSRRQVEKWLWVFMRVSGAILLVLIFTHLFMNLVLGEGVRQIDFAFVAGKWASPFWQWWDLVMLWLALIHGGNGMRTITNDYITTRAVRLTVISAIWIAVAFLILLGTLVIFTFDPCPTGAPANLVPSFCPA